MYVQVVGSLHNLVQLGEGNATEKHDSLFFSSGGPRKWFDPHVFIKNGQKNSGVIEVNSPHLFHPIFSPYKSR